MAKKTKTTAQEDKIEREYIIPLRREWIKVPRYKRANKAIKAIKEFLVRHMKIRDRDLSKIKIDNYLNEAIWFKGIRKPPYRIKIRAIKSGSGEVKAELFDLSEKMKFKKERLERRDRKAVQIAQKKAQKEEKPRELEEKKAEEEQMKEEKKEEEKEKKAAVVEAGKEMEKEAAKKMKRMKTQKVKQPKHQMRKALAK